MNITIVGTITAFCCAVKSAFVFQERVNFSTCIIVYRNNINSNDIENYFFTIHRVITKTPVQALSLFCGSLIAFFYLMVRAERNFNIDLQDVKLKKSFGPAEKSLIAEKLEAVLLCGSHARFFFH